MSSGAGWRLAAALIALALGAGCDLLTAIGGGVGLHCRSDQSCPRGMLCSAGVCVRPTTCDGDADCAVGSCRNGVCVAAGSDAAVDGSAVDGSLRDRQASDVAFADTASPDQVADIGHADGAVAADAPRADQRVSDLAAPDTRRPDTHAPDTTGTDRGPCDPDPCAGEFYCVVAGTEYACRCAGIVCNETCYPAGECCSPSACGSGSWRCDLNQCVCPPPYLDCSGNCRTGNTYYRDGDNDSYGADSVTTRACTQPSGYAAQRGDCDDGDGRVHPDQTAYFDIPANGGGFDFDCDSGETPQSTTISSCVSCTPNIHATENPSRTCHRCSDTFSYCWVDYDAIPGPTCTDCCSANAIYQLDCGCPVQAMAHANCQVDRCIGWLVGTGWADSVPACGASNSWLDYGVLDDTCVANGMNCGDLASTSTRKQKCR